MPDSCCPTQLDMAIAIFIDKHPDHGEGINNTGILLGAHVARAIWNHFTGMTGYENGRVNTAHVDWNMMPGGKWGIWRSSAAPFPHPERANGLTRNDGTVYPVLPPLHGQQYRRLRSGRTHAGPDGVNMIVHFHGHGNDNMDVLERYMIPQAMVDEKINAILVLPQGPYRARDSFCGKMEDAGGLAPVGGGCRKDHAGGRRSSRMHRRAVSCFLRTAEDTGLSLFALTGVKWTDSITHLFLFDAFYGNFEFYHAWLERENGIIEAAYTEHLATEHTHIAADSTSAPLRARFQAVPTDSRT